MGIFPKYPVFFCAFCHTAPPGRCSFRRQAVRSRAPRGDASSAPQARPNLSMRPEGALRKKALPSAEYSAPRARDEGTRLPGGGRSAPPSLFCSPLRTAQRGPRDLIDSGRPKCGLPASDAALAARPRWAVAASPPEMVPPGGTREKSSGPKSSFACLKLKCAPAPHQAFWDAPSPSPNFPSKKKGFTGEHGSPVKSRAARGAVPHCASAEAPRLGVQGAISSSGGALILNSPWRVLSWTAPAARSLFARKENGGLGSTPLGGG